MQVDSRAKESVLTDATLTERAPGGVRMPGADASPVTPSGPRHSLRPMFAARTRSAPRSPGLVAWQDGERASLEWADDPERTLIEGEDPARRIALGQHFEGRAGEPEAQVSVALDHSAGRARLIGVGLGIQRAGVDHERHYRSPIAFR